MKIVKFRDWQLSVDEELTKQTYEHAKYGSAESCNCNECRNFIENRDIFYPTELRELFEKLGIDYKRESEAAHYGLLANGLHHYGGWFHFKGTFTGKDCAIPIADAKGCTIELTPINENFSLGFRNANHLSFFDAKDGLVQIEFETKIPWTLKEEFDTE